MRYHAFLTGALAACLIGAQPADADQMTITQTMQPKTFSYPGVALDVDGLKLGMSVAATEKAISDLGVYKADPVSMGSLDVTYKTVAVISQQFPISLNARDKTGGTITAYFGTPATGSRVVEIDRILLFPNAKDAPTMKQIISALQKKYGPSTKTSVYPLIEERDALFLWIFRKDGHLASCPGENSSCNTSGMGYDPAGDTYYGPTWWYKLSATSGNDVYIEALLDAAPEDLSRAAELRVFMGDEADKYSSEASAWKQINAAAIAAYNKGQVKVATPKL